MNQLSHLTDKQCDQLAGLIRDGQSVHALNVARKLVGPTRFEKDANQFRLRTLQWLTDQAQQQGWGSDPTRWPYPYNQKHKTIIDEQLKFDKRYLCV